MSLKREVSHPVSCHKDHQNESDDFLVVHFEVALKTPMSCCDFNPYKYSGSVELVLPNVNINSNTIDKSQISTLFSID